MSVLVYDCGSVENTVTAILDTESGAMIIRGNGDIDNYADESSPWYSEHSDIIQVTVDKGITRIGSGTFYGCENLSFVEIASTVTSIGADVFQNCTSLTSIKIPKSITDIGNGTFTDSGLTEVKFYGNPPTVGTDIFDGVTADVYTPEGNEEWTETAKGTVAGNGSNLTWKEFDSKPNLIEYDELDYFWSKIKKWVNDNKSDSSLPIIDDKTFIKYLAKVVSDSSHVNTNTTLYVSNPEYFSENDCFYVKKDSTHFFYGIVSAVNNNTGALTYSIPASDGGTFFSPDDGQLIVNYGNPMNGGVYLDWANDRVDLYQNHTELERYYNIYDPIFNINAWNSTTAGIAEEDGVVDISGENNHGQAFGGVTVVKDKVMGRCFSFDGVDDYLSFPSMVNMFQNLDGCTFTFKIKINKLPSSSANVFGGIVGESNILACRVNSSGSIYATSSGGTKSIAANQLLTINDVFSVCFVFDYSNSLAKVYINGSLSNEAEWYSSSPTEVLDCFGIGAKVQTNSSAFWLNGEISDFRFFDKALTPEQIKVIYNQSLVTQYLNSNIYNPILNLDADYSTTASIAVADGVIDVSGNHNNGQAYGAVTVVEDAEMGDCFHFDNNSTSRVVLSSIGDTSTHEGYTVSLTIKHGKDTGSSWFICRRSEADNSVLDWQLVFYEGDLWWGAWNSEGTGIFPNDSRTPYPAPVIGEKHTYGISVDHGNKTAQFYYDGRPYGDLIELTDYPNMSNTQVVVGGPWKSSESSLACLCDIGDVQIYPRALTATEVYNVYQQSLNPEAFENPEKLLSYNDVNVHHFDNNSLIQNNMFRLGNLNGVPGISDNRPGVFIGGENEYIRYDKLNGLQIKGTAEKAETAQLAKQLGTTTIGSSITPIYLVNGNPTECELEAGGGRNLLSSTSMSELSFTGSTKDYNLTSFAVDSIQGNDYIVISFEAKASISRWIDFYWVDSASTSHAANSFSINPAFNLTTEYKRYYGIFKCMEMSYTLSKLRIRQSSSEHGGAASGPTIYIKKLKVEFGKAPSTWTPAPEDTVPSATKATQDGSGNTITSTYATIAKTYDDTTNTSYRGMRGLDGSTSGWVRTTSSGIIPSQSGAAGSGHCGLGTSSWYFATAYIDNIYGQIHSTNSAVLTAMDTTGAKAYSMQLLSYIKNGLTGLFSASNNANAILRINRYQTNGQYNSELGFSSNGNLYYRKFDEAAPDTSTTWSQIAFTSSNITGNAATATKLATARNIGISDADGTNTGTAASFNGTAAVTIKLPSTIKASITGNCSGSSGSCTGNAATATSATKIKTTLGEGAWYDIVGVATGFTSASSYAPYGHNSGSVSFYVDANATSGNQRGMLRLGNATANTTAAGHNGRLLIYGTGTTYLAIDSNPASNKVITIKTTGSTAREYTLPDKAGTFAMTSDIVRNFPADGSSATTVQNLTNTSSVSNTTCTLMLVMVYCISNDVSATLKNGSTTLLSSKTIHVRGVDGAGRYAGGSTTTFLLLKNDALTLSANADNIFTRVLIA